MSERDGPGGADGERPGDRRRRRQSVAGKMEGRRWPQWPAQLEVVWRVCVPVRAQGLRRRVSGRAV